jgi:hypothetical protein
MNGYMKAVMRADRRQGRVYHEALLKHPSKSSRRMLSSILELAGEICARCDQSFLAYSKRTVSHCRSTRGEPDLSRDDRRVLNGNTKGACLADSAKQLAAHGWLLFCRGARSQLLWCVASSSAGWRGFDSCIDGLGHAA